MRNRLLIAVVAAAMFASCADSTGSTDSAIPAGRITQALRGHTQVDSGTSSFVVDPVPFDEVIASSDYFVDATVVSVGPSVLNTPSGEFEVPKPGGAPRFEPLTPVIIRVNRVLATRKQAVVTAAEGSEITLWLRGGALKLAVRGDVATGYLNYRVDDGQKLPGRKDTVDLQLSQPTGVDLHDGDVAILGVSRYAIPIVTQDTTDFEMREYLAPTYQMQGVIKPAGDQLKYHVAKNGPATLALLNGKFNAHSTLTKGPRSSGRSSPKPPNRSIGRREANPRRLC